jgi:hypothetical protein
MCTMRWNENWQEKLPSSASSSTTNPILTVLYMELKSNRSTDSMQVLLEKLIVAQPPKKFSAFYGTRRFITVFTKAPDWTIACAR